MCVINEAWPKSRLILNDDVTGDVTRLSSIFVILLNNYKTRTYVSNFGLGIIQHGQQQHGSTRVSIRAPSAFL